MAIGYGNDRKLTAKPPADPEPARQTRRGATAALARQLADELEAAQVDPLPAGMFQVHHTYSGGLLTVFFNGTLNLAATAVLCAWLAQKVAWYGARVAVIDLSKAVFDLDEWPADGAHYAKPPMAFVVPLHIKPLAVQYAWAMAWKGIVRHVFTDRAGLQEWVSFWNDGRVSATVAAEPPQRKDAMRHARAAQRGWQALQTRLRAG